jgi:molybdate transport system substrate-binding protein
VGRSWRAGGAAVTLALAAALPLAGCGGQAPGGGGDGRARTLLVFAAASLTETFTELGRSFETANPGLRVKFNFAGSSALAAQINQGAPADVFAAASPATIKTVGDAGGTAGPPAVFARNRLQIAVPPDNPGRVARLTDLARPGLRVVMCAPQVPCGAAARTALRAGGLSVTPVSQEQDVRAALTKVRLGEADAALVYRTDVRAGGAGGKVTGIDFPEAAQAINDYQIAALAHAPQPALAARFVQLVRSDQGQAVLARAGFEPPPAY